MNVERNEQDTILRLILCVLVVIMTFGVGIYEQRDTSKQVNQSVYDMHPVEQQRWAQKGVDDSLRRLNKEYEDLGLEKPFNVSDE